jgi:hypothetical protein
MMDFDNITDLESNNEASDAVYGEQELNCIIV